MKYSQLKDVITILSNNKSKDVETNKNLILPNGQKQFGDAVNFFTEKEGLVGNQQAKKSILTLKIFE